MIITCEKCNARYLLASLLLGMSGRKVRCGVCGHTWFQDPVEDNYDQSGGDDGGSAASFKNLLDQDMEPIPEGVKPIPEGSSVPALSGGKQPRSADHAALRGAAAAAVIFVLIFAGLVSLRVPAVQSWPPAALLFEWIGLSVPVAGEGLIFDQISAVAKADGTGQYHLLISGNIINLRARDMTLPLVQATLRSSETETGDRWIIDLDRATIGPEETIPFSAAYKNLPAGMKEVNIRFTE